MLSLGNRVWIPRTSEGDSLLSEYLFSSISRDKADLYIRIHNSSQDGITAYPSQVGRDDQCWAVSSAGPCGAETRPALVIGSTASRRTPSANARTSFA